MIVDLPFSTFGELAVLDLEVHIRCRCYRDVIVDGTAENIRQRVIMGTRFRCTTVLHHGESCAGQPSITIRKRDRDGWTIGDHSRAMRARHAATTL